MSMLWITSGLNYTHVDRRREGMAAFAAKLSTTVVDDDLNDGNFGNSNLNFIDLVDEEVNPLAGQEALAGVLRTHVSKSQDTPETEGTDPISDGRERRDIDRIASLIYRGRRDRCISGRCSRRISGGSVRDLRGRRRRVRRGRGDSLGRGGI